MNDPQDADDRHENAVTAEFRRRSRDSDAVLKAIGELTGDDLEDCAESFAARSDKEAAASFITTLREKIRADSEAWIDEQLSDSLKDRAEAAHDHRMDKLRGIE